MSTLYQVSDYNSTLNKSTDNMKSFYIICDASKDYRELEIQKYMNNKQ